MAITLLDLLDSQFFGLLRLETQFLAPITHLLDGIAFEAPEVAEDLGQVTYSGKININPNAGLLASLSSLKGIGLGAEVTGTLILSVSSKSELVDTLLTWIKDKQPEVYKQLEPIVKTFTTFPTPGFSFQLSIGDFTLPLYNEFINAELDGAWLKEKTGDDASAGLKLPNLGVKIELADDFTLEGPNITFGKGSAVESQYFLHNSKLFGIKLETPTTAQNGQGSSVTFPNIKVLLSPDLGGDRFTSENLVFDLETGLSGVLKLNLDTSVPKPSDKAYFTALKGTLELQNSRLIELAITGQVNLSKIIGSVDPDGKMGSITLQQHDFELSVRYDPGTSKPTFKFSLGSQKDYIWQYTTPGSPLNYLASLLILAPHFLDDRIALGAATGLAGQIVKGKEITLYGVRVDQLPDDATDALPALLLDYGVKFELDADILDVVSIKSTRPLSVRYKAIGARLSIDELKPVYDPRAGTEFDISDPGLFNIGDTLGDIFQIIAARILELADTRYIEVDIALKQDLGLISVDALRIRLPLGGDSKSKILPAGVHVKVPDFIDGSGYLDIKENAVSGGIDLMLPSLKMRIHGALSVVHPKENPSLTAIYTNFDVQFPSPVPLLSSGLAIYGFGGLFGMHYRRKSSDGTDSASRALSWLKGHPKGDVQDIDKWEAAPNQWAFGARADLGLVSGRDIVSATGTFLLELPGPTLSFFVNVKFLRRDDAGENADLDANFMGFLQIAPDYVALGVHAEVNYSPFFELALDTTAYFPFANSGDEHSRDWYIRFGTPDNRVSVKVLGFNIRGYLMVHGDGRNAPGLPAELKTPGLSIALGALAQVEIGSRRLRLFFAAGTSFDMSLSVDTFGFGGIVTLGGPFLLFFVSLGAGTSHRIKVSPGTLYIHFNVEASIKIFFKKFSGSVTFSFGSYVEPEALELVTALQFQSRSPALVEGQGSDQPIDGLLNELTDKKNTFKDGEEIPIDAIPIIRFRVPPAIPNQQDTLLELSKPYPYTTEQAIPVGGTRKVSYTITKLTLTNNNTGELVTSVPWVPWPADTGSTRSAQDPAMMLRLFTYDANPISRAALYSQGVIEQAREMIEFVCTPVAEPVWVTWTFADIAQGASLDGEGWTLKGIPNDAANPKAYRSSPPDLELDLNALPLRCYGIKNLEYMPPTTVPISENTVMDLSPARVVGLAPASTPINQARLRALQMPSKRVRTVNALLNPQCGFEELGGVRLHTGGAEQLELFFLIENVFKDNNCPELIRLKENGIKDANVYEKYLEPDCEGILEDKLSQSESLGLSSRFSESLYEIVTLGGGRTLLRIAVELSEHTTSVDIISSMTVNIKDRPTMLVAIRLLRIQEVIRKERDKRAQNAPKPPLGNLSKVPMLLEPATTYTLTVNAATWAESAGSPRTFGEPKPDQTFTFKTNSEAPKSLLPWLLASSPQDRSRYHFWGERPQLTFNDESVFSIFEKYQKNLFATLRTALGEVITKEPIPLNGTTSKAIPAKILTPHEEALKKVIDEREDKCFTLEPQHINFTLEVCLEAHKTYILDIATEQDVDPSPESVVLRLAFDTGHFKNAGELAEAVRDAPLQHYYVESLENLGKGQVTDDAMEGALFTAGLPTNQPGDKARKVLIWTGLLGQEKRVALLIDSSEPLWRKRLEPERVNVEEDDPEKWCQYWRRQENLHVKVTAPDSCTVAYAMGGTRTLIFLSDAQELGGQVKLWGNGYWPLPDEDDKRKPSETQIIDLSKLPVAPLWRDAR